MNPDIPRLEYLLNAYINDSCTQDELKELKDLILSSEYEKEVKAFIKKEISRDHLLAQPYSQLLSPERADIIFNKITRKDQQAPVRSVWWKFSAAAILLILAGAGIYSMLKDRNSETIAELPTIPKQLSKDIDPGTNGAILTLSNGQRIILDSVGNGKLTTQGSTDIFNSAGSLVYASGEKTGKEQLYNTMATPRGRQYKLVLADGTKVWLNAASSIRFPVAFTGLKRNVEITGEVYFEVTKNRAAPFIVKVKNMEVQVLGTHFNINAYEDEASIQTTLIEGSLKVSVDSETTLLAPGQQAKLGKEGLKLVPQADINEAIAWKDGMFLFNKADIQSVMRQIARWYDVDVMYEGEIPRDHFGGKLPMDAKASQVLEALQQTEVHFRIEGKKIIVMP
jgi:transmembrane sensor